MTTSNPGRSRGDESPHMPDWLPRHLFPFESRFLDIDGSSIHYIDEGAGPTYLFLHGNPTWSFLYRNIIKELKRRFRCVAPDYPGFGLSKARDGYDFRPGSHARVLEQFIDKLELKSINLMVQDWGGPIGLSVAVQHPDNFQGFVIGNSFAWPVKGDKHFEDFSAFMGGPVGGFLIRNFNAFVNVLIPSGTRKKLSREVMQAYRGPFPDRASREPTHIFPREIIGSSDFLDRVEKQLPKLSRHPALILWGDKDFAFREKERTRFEAVFVRHKTGVLQGSGHYIQEDAPEEISSQIVKWHRDAFPDDV
jgi:haloalkane dehalogenase